MDVRRLLKVYNYVNDDRRAKVNIKFAALVALTVAASGVLIFYALKQDNVCPPQCSTPTSRTAYVGLAPSEIAQGGDVALVAQERLDQWRAAHPDWRVLSVEPVTQGGLTVGFNVEYQETPT